MNKTLPLIAALAALGLAAPAAAQNTWNNGTWPNNSWPNNTWDNRNGNDFSDRGLQMRIQQLQARIQNGVQRGTISRQEAVWLRDQLRALVRIERQYSRGGLNRNELRDLQQRINYFQQQLLQAERSRDWRDDRRDDRDWRDDGRFDDGRFRN